MASIEEVKKKDHEYSYTKQIKPIKPAEII